MTLKRPPGESVSPPPDTLYSTSASVIATLYVALAIELRLLRPHAEVALPEEPAERKRFLQTLGFLVVWPLASGMGLYSALVALYQGSSWTLANLTMIGTAATVVIFFMTSLNLAFRLFGLAMPAKLREHRKPILIGLGLALMAGGIVWMILSPHA
jgi:hypothetical protein